MKARPKHFDNLVRLAQGLPAYAPNELELQMATLQGTVMELRGTSEAAVNAYNELANARVQQRVYFFQNTQSSTSRRCSTGAI